MSLIDALVRFVAVFASVFGMYFVIADVKGGTNTEVAPICPDATTQHDDLMLIAERYMPVFPRDGWQMTIRDMDGSTKMRADWQAWQGQPQGVASAEILIWSCGYTEAMLEPILSNSAISDWVANWDKHTITGRCRVAETEIVDVTASFFGDVWRMRFWFERLSSTRVFAGYLSVPMAETARFEAMSRQLHPDAPNCDVSLEGEEE